MDCYYGKYRGLVTSTDDPLKKGRIKAKCPAIFGEYETSWCLPNVPYAGKDVGIVFTPKIGDGVWVEFEKGNISYPIWTGCWFGDNECSLEQFEIKTVEGSISFKNGDIKFTNAL